MKAARGVDAEGCECVNGAACDSSCTANFQSVGQIKKSSHLNRKFKGEGINTYINWIGVTSQGWCDGWLTLKAFGKNRARMEANIEPLFFTLIGRLV